tara:strand:+ start:262 stop:612 length:351 start_codon:yes stop_codon:yes gene_type:complete
MSKKSDKSTDLGVPIIFKKDEVEIYCNKLTRESYIFHEKELDYSNMSYAEYDHDSFHVHIFFKDGVMMDLGVTIKWLLRPYFSKSEEIQIIRTKNGKAFDGHFLPLKHINNNIGEY